MKALLLAESCNPVWTSVPLVGFNMVQALAARDDLDVVLVTHVRNREALQQHPLSQQIEIVYIDNEWIAKPLYNVGKLLRGGHSLGWTTNMAVNWPAYIAFEKQVARTFRSRLNSGEFDVIHRITPVSPTLPSPLASATDVPMIIGPLNGGLPWPKEFPSLHSSEREWLSPVRNVYKKFPWYQSSYRRLAAVISGSRHTATEVPECFAGRKLYLPENGIDAARFQIADGWAEPDGAFNFITVGRLVPYKGFDMVLQAMAASPVLRTCRLTIVGDGPQRSNLETMVSESGLTDRVAFTGWMEQCDLSQHLRNSQAFVFPSLREFGGGVVLEAMASGLPSIIVNYGGPAELIDGTNGIRLPLTRRPELVTNLITAMEALATNDDRCRRMSAAAVDTVRKRFTWDRKAATMVQWYRELADPETPMGQDSAIEVSETIAPDSSPLLSPELVLAESGRS